MGLVTEERLRTLLDPYVRDWAKVHPLPESLVGQLEVYLELLVRWNAKTNLTAVRDPEEMLTRHFGESLFAGSVLGGVAQGAMDVLDLGSGAGFPGLPMQLLCPEWKVTLGESQGKKAAFLREVVRRLGLKTEVWAARVETMPRNRKFGAVVMRAVDRMDEMTNVAAGRLVEGGVLLQMVAGSDEGPGRTRMPGTVGSFVELSWPKSSDVPRGTLD